MTPGILRSRAPASTADRFVTSPSSPSNGRRLIVRQLELASGIGFRHAAVLGGFVGLALVVDDFVIVFRVAGGRRRRRVSRASSG
jgi:hypothetical protein